MNKPLRVLHLEDEPDFSTLISVLLEKEGLHAEITLVTDFAAFNAALQNEPVDIILADYVLPTCNGVQALQVAREKCPDVPFVLLSGAIGEHAAIDILRSGATDYVLKSGLERLVPAIRRAVEGARERAQRKNAQAEVREREKQYRLIFDGSPVPMWVSDLTNDAFLEVNEAAIRRYGYSREEFLARKTADICSPAELAAAARYLEQNAGADDSGIGHGGLCSHRNKQGTQIGVEITWSIIRYEDRRALLTMAKDVTELQSAIEALKRSEASLAAAQRIAQLGSWELDLLDPDNLQHNPLRWSDETYRIFGLPLGQALVTSNIFFNVVHADDRARVQETVLQAFRGKEPYEVEHRIVQPGGKQRMVRERAEFALDAAGKPVQMRGVVMDITERADLEQQLRHSQKMEAIGQLAGGMAHDFNNILTVTHGHALLLLNEKTLSKSGKESAQRIAQAAERAAGLTRPLLAFSRRQVMQLRPLDMNQVVNGMTVMLGRILGEDIALQLRYWAQPAMVQADMGMIEQVLLNLAVNARDAMPNGGHLAIEIAVANVTAKHLDYHPEARVGTFVCLSVIDNGRGIAPDCLRRIFEPFFTTKEGKRTGLGLATVYGIVKQHQGWIEAESELGKGATFRVYLPMTNQAAAGGKPLKPEVRGGAETILVVEDEPAVRELVCKILSSFGYGVLQAESGMKALDVWRKSKKKIDLLLTDIIMPDGMNGLELADKLRKARPQLKVIYSSGYSPEAVGRDLRLQKGHKFLQKPHDIQKLAVTVRACLDEN